MSKFQNPWEQPARTVGRYRLYGEIASGGMATVHMGRLVGPVGFSRVVAIKRLHSQYAKDPSFVDMFLDEARLAGRIRHPNVVSTLDVASVDDELFLVMDYVHGESLGYLIRACVERGDRIPPRIASAILINALLGLHAAHEATDDRGRALNIVHRDISPQNILVGTDGVARVADFGVAKAASRVHTTQGGEVKGKVSYMSPEQLQGHDLDRRTDLFGAAIVLWEALVGKRLFGAGDVGSSMQRILMMDPEPPSKYVVEVPPALDSLLEKALSKKREDRFSTAREMAQALESAMPPAGALEIGSWVEGLASPALHQRNERNALRASEPPEVTKRFPGAVQLDSYKPPLARPLTGADVTEISLATGTPSLPRLRSKKWPLAAGAIGGVVVLIGVLVAISKPSDSPKAGAQGGGTASSLSVPNAVPVNPSPAKSAEVKATDVESLPKEVPSAALAKPAPSMTATTVRAKPKAVSCNPPYILKADGTKKFKPECF